MPSEKLSNAFSRLKFSPIFSPDKGLQIFVISLFVILQRGQNLEDNKKAARGCGNNEDDKNMLRKDVEHLSFPDLEVSNMPHLGVISYNKQIEHFSIV